MTRQTIIFKRAKINVRKFRLIVANPANGVNEIPLCGIVSNLIDKTLNKSFNKQEFEKGLYKLSTDKGWETEEFDIDGDGKNESIISANSAMNHTPNIALVVKNGNIVFEKNGANIQIEEVYGGIGFVLKETVDWNIGQRKITRYNYKNGGFMPVWTQKACLVNFE